MRTGGAAAVLFVTRHRGALEWARASGFETATAVTHLEVEQLLPGDTVIGTLPVHLAAAVCARGARYLHLALDMPEHLRGVELSAEQMAQCGARVEQYLVRRLET